MMTALTYGSLFSGIGGFDLGFDRAGLVCRWQVEKDDKARAVLAKRWPGVVRYEDVKEVGKQNLEPVDIICGGFPCQDLSVAGQRGGLAGERSGLWFEFYRVITELKPRWCIIENVPGLLSSCGCGTCGAVRRILRVHKYLRGKRKINQPCAVCRAGKRMLASHRGRDFAVILRGLVECGYGVAWRILDSQYFGVAQRRRRVFIVASLGSGDAAKVLFERESSAGDTPPSRETGACFAAAITERTRDAGRNLEIQEDLAYALTNPGSGGRPHSRLIAFDTTQVTSKGNYSNPKSGDPCHPLSSTAHPPAIAFSETGPGWWRDGVGTLRERDYKDGNSGLICELADTLNSGGNNGGFRTEPGAHLTSTRQGVRRLTPVECERLQAFPAGWTSGQSDSERYRQLGNAVTVTVAEWIAGRIRQVEQEQKR